MKMRNFLLLAMGLMLSACTKDFDENAADANLPSVNSKKIISTEIGAERGTLAIKVAPEMAETIDASATRSGYTRSGIESIDQSLNILEASRFKRIFIDPLFEEDLCQAGLNRWYRVSFPEEFSLQEAARLLAAHPEVELVEFMHQPVHTAGVGEIRPLSEVTRAEIREEVYPENDKLLPRQWHYHNTGAIKRSVVGADINLFKAWEYCTGDEEIIVAVIDQPVQTSHPDLQANMWVNTYDADESLKHGANFCTQNDTPIAIDWNYKENGYVPVHGTHVAGTVAAVNGNDLGVCGVAGGSKGKGGVKIMGCQIFYKEDNILEAAADALVWAANRGALIAQCSFGYSPATTMQYWSTTLGAEVDAIKYFINHERTNSPINGGVVIFAAGNDGNNVFNGVQVKDKQMLPAAYPYVVAVAATAPDNYPGYYTSYGTWVDVSAPGGDSSLFGATGMILSTITEGFGEDLYGYSEGTSMACPHVSGIAALGLSYAKKLGKQFTAEEFRSMICASCYAIDGNYQGTHITEGYLYDAYGNYTGSSQEVILNWQDYNGKMGAGQMDAFKMLMAVEGTPVMVVAPGQEVELPVKEILGGIYENDNLRIKLEAENDDEAKEMGISLNVEGLAARVSAAKVGSTRILLKRDVMNGNSSVSGSTTTHPVAIICREHQATNGGWL